MPDGRQTERFLGVGPTSRRTTNQLPEDPAFRVIVDHADHSSAFLVLNDGTEHYLSDDRTGLVAYRRRGRRHLVQLCGPITPPQHRRRLLVEFLDWSHRQGRRVTAVQLTRSEAEIYAAHGFVVNQLGASYSIDLMGYALRGRRFVKTRNMINHARRRGVTVQEIAPTHPGRAEVDADLDSIDRSWLRTKGRHVKELTFMVGERGGRGRNLRRLFVARHQGAVVAYVTFSPVFGSRPGWLYDLTRRSPDAPPGTIEAIFHEAATRMQQESVPWLHLGLTPFAGLDTRNDLPQASRTARRVIEAIGAHGPKLYPARSQQAFKLKWGPTLIEPEYLAFEGGLRPGALWQLLRITNTV